VDSGIISGKTLERALKILKASGKRLGELLRERGIVTDEEIVEALAGQLNLRTATNFANHPFSKDLLDLFLPGWHWRKRSFPSIHMTRRWR
jgi:hypothetical protein